MISYPTLFFWLTIPSWMILPDSMCSKMSYIQIIPSITYKALVPIFYLNFLHIFSYCCTSAPHCYRFNWILRSQRHNCSSYPLLYASLRLYQKWISFHKSFLSIIVTSNYSPSPVVPTKYFTFIFSSPSLLPLF